ncbi:MAG: ribosome biogenesis GTP-binding protein YihA/YsxC [Bacteroidota bacterium]
MKIKKAEFVVSNSDYKKCPKDKIPEFAFIGRSNVGKSSLINMMVERKGLAKTSGKPGKTQLINHFRINTKWYLVDLPGYGWAKVSKTSRSQFEKIITGYLLNRENLISICVLIDIRLEPQKIDMEFINWMGENGLPFIIVFTKTDKLSKQKAQQSVARFKKTMLQDWEELPLMIQTSAVNKLGRDELLKYIEKYLDS